MLHYQIILLICPSFLFRKSILSPKCISPISKSLSPGVNIRLYHHSTETETHIHFIPKMAKSFDLLGFSRQKADCFNMCRSYYVNTIFQPRHSYRNTILCYYFFAFFFAVLCMFLILSKYSSSTGDKF